MDGIVACRNCGKRSRSSVLLRTGQPYGEVPCSTAVRGLALHPAAFIDAGREVRRCARSWRTWGPAVDPDRDPWRGGERAGATLVEDDGDEATLGAALAAASQGAMTMAGCLHLHQLTLAFVGATGGWTCD